MKILKKILFIIICLFIINLQTIFAWWIDHFEITISPDEAQIWEAVDLTVEVVDKNNVIIEDYDWIVVIFSETDPEAEFPFNLKENTYTFLTSDQWKIKFENAVIFKKEWRQEINVYDLDDDTVMWIWEVNITKVEVIENIDVNILSPENWLTIWENSIIISGSSQKNHSIKIIINNENTIETVTNENWLFEKKIEGLFNWNNVFKVQVLNADKNIIWESNDVNIKVDLNIPRIKDIQITPSEVETESSYEIKVFANNWLTEVNAIINDTVIQLQENEKEKWVYIANSYSPAEADNYTIDITLKDALGHEVQELWAWNLVVKKIELNAGIEKKEIIIEEEEKELKITWLKVIELKSKSVIKWNEIEGVEWYDIYKKTSNWELELIERINESKYEIAFSGSEIKYDYFAIKPIGKTSSWELYEWNLSNATKVKTWPELLILFIISLFIWWMIFIFKSKKI